MNTITERIEHIRVQNGLSYQDLANMIGGITSDAVRKAIVRRKLKDYYINIIAEKLHINKDWILTGNGEIKNTFSFEGPSIKSSVKVNEDGVVSISIENLEFPVKELAGILEEHYLKLMSDSSFKLFMKDKINIGMFEFFKDHGIEVKVMNKPEDEQ